jgi:nitrogen fixation-related uncharacterized protein
VFDTWVIAMEITVSFLIGAIVLFLVVRSIKNGEFDDGDKMMGGLLFDSNEDLQDAILQEKKEKQLRENRQNNKNKEKNDI